MLELFHIITRFTIRDGVSRGLLVMSRRFRKTNEEALLLQKRVDKIKTTMLAGAGMAFMGGLGLAATAKMLKPAQEYLHTLTQAHAVGMKQVEIANLTAAAWQTTSKVMTVSSTEAIQMGISLRRILGSAQLATTLLPEMARFKTAYIMAKESGRLGGSSADPVQMVYTAAKAAEMAGATSTKARFDKFMDNMVRVVVGTAGKVTPMMYMGLLKYARGAGISLSDTTLFRTAPILMEEMALGKGGAGGGARGGPGAIYNAWYRMLVQGVMTKSTMAGFKSLGLIQGGQPLTAAAMAKYQDIYKGLLTHPGVIGKGMPQKMLGLPLIGGKLAASDPIQWVLQYLEPALRKQYPTLNRKQLGAKAALYFKGNSLAAFLASNAIAREWQIRKEMRMLGGVPGTDKLMGLSLTDPNSTGGRIKAQWHNLMTALGVPLTRVLIPAGNRLASLLNRLAILFTRHQKIAEMLIVSFGGLSAAMAIGGVILILRGAILGLGVAFEMLSGALAVGSMATGIGEITLALWGLYEVIKHWKTIIPAWKDRVKNYKSDVGLFHIGMASKNQMGLFHIGLAHSATANRLGIHVRPKTDHRPETHVIMDGKKVGKIVQNHIGNNLTQQAMAQKSNFDIGLNLPSPNYSF